VVVHNLEGYHGHCFLRRAFTPTSGRVSEAEEAFKVFESSLFQPGKKPDDEQAEEAER